MFCGLDIDSTICHVWIVNAIISLVQLSHFIGLHSHIFQYVKHVSRSFQLHSEYLTRYATIRADESERLPEYKINLIIANYAETNGDSYYT